MKYAVLICLGFGLIWGFMSTVSSGNQEDQLIAVRQVLSSIWWVLAGLVFAVLDHGMNSE